MKIVHVIESGGGSAEFVLYLIKYLPQHDHAVIYSDRTFGSKLEEVKGRFLNASFYHWEHAVRELNLVKDLKALLLLCRLIARIEGDAIHLHSSKAGFLGRVACFLLRRKNVIYTPNGLPFIRKDISPFKIKLYEYLEKMANHFSGRVIACSKSEADELIKRKIPSSYINNGTEITPHYIEHPSKEGELTIVTSGRITIQKNPVMFNEIAMNFQGNGRVKFIWIGMGELEHLLDSNNIIRTGWLGRKEVIDILAKANVYISTASWEGLPFAVLEAMSLRKPLLLSNCVGNIDLIKNGSNGFLFSNSSEAIQKINFLLNNSNQMNAMGNHSYELLEKEFDVKQMAAKYEMEYSYHILN